MFCYKISKSVRFQKDVYLNLISLLWIAQPFTDDKFNLSYLKLLSCGLDRLDPKGRF